MIKLGDLLSILNQINNNILFTMEKIQTFLRYNDEQNWYINLDGYLQQTNRLKTIFHIFHMYCLTNIQFSLASRICIIVEDENVTKKNASKSKKNLLE